MAEAASIQIHGRRYSRIKSVPAEAADQAADRCWLFPSRPGRPRWPVLAACRYAAGGAGPTAGAMLWQCSNVVACGADAICCQGWPPPGRFARRPASSSAWLCPLTDAVLQDRPYRHQRHSVRQVSIHDWLGDAIDCCSFRWPPSLPRHTADLIYGHDFALSAHRYAKSSAACLAMETIQETGMVSGQTGLRDGAMVPLLGQGQRPLQRPQLLAALLRRQLECKG